MRKLALLTAILAILLIPISAFSYTAYVGVDNSLDFSLLNTIGFDVGGASIGDLTLTIYPQGSNVLVDCVANPGAVPEIVASLSAWDIFKVTSPTDGVSGIDSFTGGNPWPLAEGVMLSLEGTGPFTLSNFTLGSFSEANGIYPLPFNVAENQFADGAEYTYNNVPIPGSILLLGSGLVGLIGFARRRRSS